jgi:hypothetical protein
MWVDSGGNRRVDLLCRLTECFQLKGHDYHLNYFLDWKFQSTIEIVNSHLEKKKMIDMYELDLFQNFQPRSFFFSNMSIVGLCFIKRNFSSSQ